MSKSRETPHSSDSNGKALRFGGLIRVSTESQEKQGESLRTQRAANERDVERLGGTIVKWYGGQEHATAGWEKQQVDKLLADAAKGEFDAVIVAYADRWSRDNVKSKEGLDIFRKHKVRFFVGTMEMDLFDPQCRFILGMNAEVAEFITLQQRKKSIEVRIDNAREGRPSSGKMPFGRTWDSNSQTWVLDPEKEAMIGDIAKRYLAGGSLLKLAKEYHLSHCNLCRILADRCGTKWTIHFRDADLDIDETVTLEVPPLLDPGIIKRVRERLLANRTYIRHGGRPMTNTYLLSGYIFCEACGYALCGAPDHRGQAYYCHRYAQGSRGCPLKPRPWVPAAKIEEAVVGQLFNMFGSPAAIEQAVKAAVPDCEEALVRQARLREDMAKVATARSRVLGLVERDAITDAQAEEKLRDLKEREAQLRHALDELADDLVDVPDPEAVRCYVEWGGGNIFVHDGCGNTYEGGNDVQTYIGMSNADRRQLIQAVFDTDPVRGKKAGIYISLAGENRPNRPKKWAFRMHGRLSLEFVMSHLCQPPKPQHNELPPVPFEILGIA